MKRIFILLMLVTSPQTLFAAEQSQAKMQTTPARAGRIAPAGSPLVAAGSDDITRGG